MRARGLDPHARADRVTADEWLAAHQHHQTDAERDHHVIDELDVTDATDVHEEARDVPSRPDAHEPERDVRERADEGPPAETAVPDIRESSSPDPTERADPKQRRHVRPLDDMHELVERAQEALTEMDNRGSADAVHEAEDNADYAAQEDARRADLIRRTGDDHTAKPADAETAGEELVRER